MNSAPNNKVRVAVLQFGVTETVVENLATCLRMLDAVSIFQPALVVLPAFCNHSAWYRDEAYAAGVAVEREGSFVSAIAAKSAEYRCAIKFHVTLLQADGRVVGIDLLCSPQGEVTTLGEEQQLFSHDANTGKTTEMEGETASQQMKTDAALTGAWPEAGYALTLGETPVLVSSWNTFAEPALSARATAWATEQRTFVIAANTVETLVPAEASAAVSDRLGGTPEQLQGAGASQIIAPDGSVLVKAPSEGVAVLVVDLDPAQTRA